jgi:threonine/homoserine/homoserine lactone efflux protein
MTGYLLMGITYGFAAAAQPGPLQTFFISRTLSSGWARTIPASFAPLLTDGPIAALALLVLTAVPLWFEEVLRVAGGLFLLYLAYGSFRSWREYRHGGHAPSSSGAQNLWQAVIVNALNPAPYLGWSLFLGPLFLTGWRESPAGGIALLSGFYGTMVLTSIVIMGLFSLARPLGERVNRVLLGLSGVGLAGLGLYQLILAARAAF